MENPQHDHFKPPFVSIGSKGQSWYTYEGTRYEYSEDGWEIIYEDGITPLDETGDITVDTQGAAVAIQMGRIVQRDAMVTILYIPPAVAT